MSAIAPDVWERIRDTEIAASEIDLAALSKLDPDVQRKVVDAMFRGEAWTLDLTAITKLPPELQRRAVDAIAAGDTRALHLDPELSCVAASYQTLMRAGPVINKKAMN